MSIKKEKLTARINQIKKSLMEVGPIMPESLSQQTRRSTDGRSYGSYWKLGDTHEMKSRSLYIPSDIVPSIRVQNEAFKKFKKLTEEWIKLALKIAEINLSEAKKDLKRKG